MRAGLAAIALALLMLGACGAPAEPAGPENTYTATEDTTMRIKIEAGGETFTAVLAENEAARELADMLPLTLTLSDYGGFEKVGPLGARLTASNRQLTTRAGDIVLYSGNQIVMFYGSNSWSYTPLARVEDLTGWAEALGRGDVTVRLTPA